VTAYLVCGQLILYVISLFLVTDFPFSERVKLRVLRLRSLLSLLHLFCF